MYVANEGKLIVFVAPESGPAALAAMQATPGGERAALIGKVQEQPEGMVLVKTAFGGTRIMDYQGVSFPLADSAADAAAGIPGAGSTMTRAPKRAATSALRRSRRRQRR